MTLSKTVRIFSLRNDRLRVAIPLMISLVGFTSGAHGAPSPRRDDAPSLLSVKLGGGINSKRSAAVASALTSLGGLARYPCPERNGFLDDTCREPLFPPCANTGTGRPIAVTTDRYVSLRVSIQEASDGDVWQWFWHKPDGTVVGSAQTTFRATFNGTQNCFVFQTFLQTYVICGARSIEAEWGNGSIHDDNTAGLWNIEVQFNGSRIFFEPFELFFAPHADLAGFTFDNTLAIGGSLGLDLNLRVAPLDTGLWAAKTKLGLNPSSLSVGQNFPLIRGSNAIRIALPDHGIGRFDSDAILTIQTETTTGNPTLGGCVPPIPLRSTLAIPLPVIFIHGMVPPDNATKGQTNLFISGSFIPGQADKLFDFLIGSTGISAATRRFDTSDFRLPYGKSGASDYPTLYLGDWRTAAYDNRTTVASQLESVIDTAIANTYSKRVNIIGHSAGGVIGRYLVQRGVQRNDVKISRLVLAGSPNNGTSEVYKQSSGLSGTFVNALTAGIPGLLLPPGNDGRGPYQDGNPCLLISPPPATRTWDDATAIPSTVTMRNIIGLGFTTSYDIVGKPDSRSGWFTFKDRSLKRNDTCAEMTAFRVGDGSITRSDAIVAGGSNVEVQLNLGFLNLRNVAPHVFMLEDAGVRTEILRGLRVQSER